MKCRSPRSAEKTNECISGVGRKRREPAGERPGEGAVTPDELQRRKGRGV